MKIAIALSGGVDSAVAGALLKDAGHTLIGVTALVWPDSRCCDANALRDARLVAEALSIPYFTVDVMPEFKKTVVDPFVFDYQHGRTPNPCPLCNTYIRFGVMWERILEQYPDCGAVATGHYTIIEKDLAENRWTLKKGVDENKDQSYMLYGLSQEQLSRTLTPLGTYTKEQARALAEKFGLFVSKKPDSQDACFVSGDYHQFLKDYADEAGGMIPGNIVDTHGNVLGTHEGIVNYTIGQRKGLALQRKGETNTPLYVVAIDAEKNQVIVGADDEMCQPSCRVGDINWISPAPESPINISVRIRYNSDEVPAQVIPEGDRNATVFFEQPQRAVAPGQAAVFYDGEVVVGGGIIIQGG